MDKTQLLIEFIQIGIVGTALTFVIEFIKSRYGVNSNTTKGIAIGGSVVLGAIYWFLVNTPLWLPIVGILGSATTLYSLLIRKGEKEKSV